MTSPLARAMETSGRFKTQEQEHWVQMDAPTECSFEDLPLKPLSATKTAYVVMVVQRIQGAKLPLPKLPAIAEKLSKGDQITMGPQCGLWAKLDDIQSYQLTCIPKDDSFDLIKMIRFKIRTAVSKIKSALYSDTYMIDISLLNGRNKSPVVMQKLFTGLGGNQVRLTP